MQESYNRLLSQFNYLQALWDAIPNNMFYKDVEGRYLGCNEAFTRQVGLTKEEIVGKTVFEIFPPQMAQIYHEKDAALLKEGGVQITDTVTTWSDGSDHNTIVYKTLFHNPDGSVGGIVGIIIDITDLKKAEAALKEQLAFENSINRIAEAILFNNTTSAILQEMVHIIGETLTIDRTLLYDINISTNTAYGLCEWDSPRLPGISPTLSDWSLDVFKYSIGHVWENHCTVESHCDDPNHLLIREGSAEIIHGKMNVGSVLYYPFSFHENGFYLLILHQGERIRRWRQEEKDYINAVTKQVELAIQKINLLEERKKAEQTIWQEKERAQVTLQSIGDAVITTDINGKVEYLNAVAEDLTGWKTTEAKGKPLLEVFNIIDENTGKPTDNPVATCLSEGRIVGLSNHTVLLNRDGHRFAIEDSASPIKNRDGDTIGAILVFHDVSEKRSLMQQLLHKAYHDPLTGLPNRVLFNERVSFAINQAHRNNEGLAVMFLDLDRFKQVNDMKGHAIGDKLLKSVGKKLFKVIRETDTVARLGGDEFTILLAGVKDVNHIAKMAARIMKVLEKPISMGGQDFTITASMGIALYPNDGADGETLLKNADAAMYRAKDHGRDNYQLYTPAMNKKIMERITLENSLRQALKNGEFEVYYQPQFNTNSLTVSGMEALIRWNHPERGLVFPADFIPVAEETGLIIPIGEWVLRTACAQNKAWQDQGLGPLRVNVNLSACQFKQHNLVERVAQILKETGLDPSWLELEITESALIEDVDFTIATLKAFRAMGVRISMDDFGTGYSSLSYLKKFPIDCLKIDRSFVRDITVNPEDAAIVSTVIVLANNLKLKVIAEGVETREQLILLKEQNCHEMQGYYFSRPVPSREIIKFFS